MKWDFLLPRSYKLWRELLTLELQLTRRSLAENERVLAMHNIKVAEQGSNSFDKGE